MTNFFRYKHSEKDKPVVKVDDVVGKKEANFAQSFIKFVKRDLLASQVIPKFGWFTVNFICCRYKRNKHYKDMIRKSSTRLSKDLDL